MVTNRQTKKTVLGGPFCEVQAGVCGQVFNPLNAPQGINARLFPPRVYRKFPQQEILKTKHKLTTSVGKTLYVTVCGVESLC